MSTYLYPETVVRTIIPHPRYSLKQHPEIFIHCVVLQGDLARAISHDLKIPLKKTLHFAFLEHSVSN